MLFLSEFVHFSSDDYSLNAQALTWYEKMQPIYLSSEVSLLNNKEHWVKMLRDRIIQTKSKLEEYSVKLGAFKTRDRFSEAYACVEDLNKMTQEIQSFHQTVSLTLFTTNYEYFDIKFNRLMKKIGTEKNS